MFLWMGRKDFFLKIFEILCLKIAFSSKQSVCEVPINSLFFYHIMILFYFVVGSTSSGSAFVIAPNIGAKIILSRSHFEDNSYPYISWSASSIRISHTFVLFKNVTLILINYLETWLHSDNTSCYYTFSPYWYRFCFL